MRANLPLNAAQENDAETQVNYTVLVVDDEPVVRMLVLEVLEDLGYKGIEAADGPTGLELLKSGQRIDLLVADFGLPGGLNGQQLAKAGRIARPDLKILFITGYGEEAVIDDDAGPAVQILTKPFALDMLATLICSLTAGSTSFCEQKEAKKL
jgi:CheY-like chemotaxis protein